MPVVETTPPGTASPKQLRLAVDVAPGRAALHAHRLRRRVDVDAAHLRQVDDEAAVVDRVAGDVVAAALDRERELVLAGEVDRVDDVGRARCTARSAPAGGRSARSRSSERRRSAASPGAGRLPGPRRRTPPSPLSRPPPWPEPRLTSLPPRCSAVGRIITYRHLRGKHGRGWQDAHAHPLPLWACARVRAKGMWWALPTRPPSVPRGRRMVSVI